MRDAGDLRGKRGPHPLLVAPALQGAFGPQSTLTLESLAPQGGARWRVTVVGQPADGLAEQAGRGLGAAAAAPPGGPMLTTTTAELVTRPESCFAIAAMILCGARLEVPAGDQAAAAEILACAAASAPAELELPDGRRVRPQGEELDRLRLLLPRALAPGAKATSWVVVWLEAPPWAPAGAAPAGTAPPALAGEDYLVIPSAGHYAALQQALALNTFGPSEGSRFPRAQLEKGGARGFAELRPVTPEQEMLMAPEEAAALASKVWEQRGELSDLDADVLDVISATWLRHGPRAASERVAVFVDDLLRARGLQPKKSGQGRRGGFEPEQRADLWRCLLHLQDIWLDIAAATVVDQDRRGRRTQRTRALQSRAFVMTDRIGQRRLDGSMDVEAILVTPGEAFGRFLLGPGRQLALLSSEALRYDPLRQRPEKRLARYLSWQWRVGAHSGDFIRTYRVSTLLDELGLEASAHDPARTRERFEKALDCLEHDRLISGWQYGDGWREDLPRQSWVPRWLEARVVVEAPEVIKNAYHGLDRLAEQAGPKPAALPAAESWAARVKRHREALRVSQMVAAEQLGVSRAYLAQVERGRPPSPALEAKLKRWFEAGQ
ncbi:MAG TPA: helix-turn-helix transcriptional regulator [Thermoanaerobaculia bacterium]|nr:helix-turn-helix transcriptional regulator [Thermoanaerobaculia bacterium]